MDAQPEKKYPVDLETRINAMQHKYDTVIKPFHNEERIPLIVEYYETHSLDETVERFITTNSYVRKVLRERDVFIREDIMEAIEPDNEPLNIN